MSDVLETQLLVIGGGPGGYPAALHAADHGLKVTLVDEGAKLTGEKPRSIRFQHCIIASGSVPTIPKTFALDDPRVMDSTSALLLPDVPKKLLVIGGGYIGLEIGSVYAALGTKITVVEFMDG